MYHVSYCHILLNPSPHLAHLVTYEEANTVSIKKVVYLAANRFKKQEQKLHKKTGELHYNSL